MPVANLIPNPSPLLSAKNQQLLWHYGDRLYHNHLKSYYEELITPPRGSFLGRAWHWLTGCLSHKRLKDLCLAAGTVLAYTHGPELTNWLIKKAVQLAIFKDFAPPSSNADTSWFNSLFSSPKTVDVLTEGVQLAISPRLRPLIEVGILFAIGTLLPIALIAIASLLHSIYCFCFGKKRAAARLTLNPLTDLRQQIKQHNGKRMLGNRALAEEEFALLSKRITQYSICQELLQLNKNEGSAALERFFAAHMQANAQGKTIFCDQKEASEEELQKILKSKQWLQKSDNAIASKAPLKMVKIFARHA